MTTGTASRRAILSLATGLFSGTAGLSLANVLARAWRWPPPKATKQQPAIVMRKWTYDELALANFYMWDGSVPFFARNQAMIDRYGAALRTSTYYHAE